MRREIWNRVLVLAVACLVMIFANLGTASAYTTQDIQAILNDTPFYDPYASCQTMTVTSTLNAWLQATALHESNNNPTENSGNQAYGKYQFIPNTWKGYAAAYYPPALQYPTANLAPVSMQDAVAYLANLTNYKNFGGNPFWLAVNWYWPQDDRYYPDTSNPALNTVPGTDNGSTTVADYANGIVKAIANGSLNGKSLSSVSLTYASAPDFQTYLAKDGGSSLGSSSPVTVSAPSSSCAASASTSSCNLVGSNQSVTGPNAAILCEAEKYNGIYYLYGGGHGYQAFRSACPESAIATASASSSATDPGPCATDCTGLVSVAVDAVYHQQFDWTVSDSTGALLGNGAQYWEQIPISQAQAGDIVTSTSGDGTAPTGTDGHVEIVEYVKNNTVYTFGSHSNNDITSSIYGPASGWNTGAWRYIGPGSGG